MVLVWCSSSSSPLLSDLCGPELTGKEDNVEIACHGPYQGLHYTELLSMFRLLEFW